MKLRRVSGSAHVHYMTRRPRAVVAAMKVNVADDVGIEDKVVVNRIVAVAMMKPIVVANVFERVVSARSLAL